MLLAGVDVGGGSTGVGLGVEIDEAICAVLVAVGDTATGVPDGTVLFSEAVVTTGAGIVTASVVCTVFDFERAFACSTARCISEISSFVITSLSSR